MRAVFLPNSGEEYHGEQLFMQITESQIRRNVRFVTLAGYSMVAVPAVVFAIAISYFGSDFPRTPIILALLSSVVGAFWYKHYCSANFIKYVDLVASRNVDDASEITRLIELACSVQLEAPVYDRLASVVLGLNYTNVLSNRTIDLLVRKSLGMQVVTERLLPHIFDLVNQLRQANFPFQHQTVQVLKRLPTQK